MRPSQLPMLAECVCYESSGGNAVTEAGKLRHEALRARLEGTPEPLLEESDRESVIWAEEYVRLKAPMNDYPLRCEFHVNPVGPDFTPLFDRGGTLDVACGPVLFDLKTRERNYDAQMMAYALGMFQEFGWPEVEVHLMFAETRRAQVYKLTEAIAARQVMDILARARASDRQPTPCDYCGWCARRITCPALVERTNALVSGREDWQLEQWHSSDIQSAAEMGKALRLARQVAEWCESVEHHAKEMALKQGLVPAGYKVQTRQGNRFIPSVTDAFAKLGLPQDEFLKACECKPSSVFEVYAAFNGIKKTTAEKEVERKLTDTIQRKPSSVSLVAAKE